MLQKENALQDIVLLAKSHNVTLDEIASALTNSQAQVAQQSSGILSKLFGYIGGILFLLVLAFSFQCTGQILALPHVSPPRQV